MGLGLDANAGAGSGGGPPSYEGPLDLVPGARVAFSTARALSASDIGSPAYTIRESGDDTTQAFNFQADGSVDAAAITAFLDGNDGFVVTWNDYGAEGENVTQATAADQPEWVSAGINGKPGADFSAGFLATAGNVTLGAAGAMTAFIVAKTSVDISDGTQAQMFGMDFEQWNTDFVGDWRIIRETAFTTKAAPTIEYSSDQEGATLVFIRADNLVEGNITTASLMSPFLLDFAVSDAAMSVKINGATWNTLQNASSGAVGAMTERLAIGANDAVTPGAARFPGVMVELIIYGTILSDPDRLAIRQNIADYYGITLS